MNLVDPEEILSFENAHIFVKERKPMTSLEAGRLADGCIEKG